MRIITELVDFLTANGIVITDVDSFYDDESTRLMIRSDPGQSVETRYMDKSRAGVFSYSLYARNVDAQEAVALLFLAEQVLDLPEGFETENGVQFIKSETITSAHFIQKTLLNERIYISSFTLDYYMED